MSSKKVPQLNLAGDINEETLAKVVEFLSENKKRRVIIFLISEGGDARIGLEIYNAIQRHSKVTCIAAGYCQSIAVLIMCGANKRLATLDTEFLIHFGSLGSSTQAGLNFGIKLFEKIDKIYLKHLDISKEYLALLNNSETPFGIERAIELGLIDGEYKI